MKVKKLVAVATLAISILGVTPVFAEKAEADCKITTNVPMARRGAIVLAQRELSEITGNKVVNAVVTDESVRIIDGVQFYHIVMETK